MIQKSKEKAKAIRLRRQGLSYREILQQVPVAKSTLSLWLRSVGLSKKQEQRLTEKKLAAMQRGAEARRRERIRVTESIKKEAKGEIGKVSKRDLWMIGAALYWAEGSKEKAYTGAVLVQLGNSDPRMVKLYLTWLQQMFGVSLENDLSLYIHIHETADIEKARKYWSEETGISMELLSKIILKKHNINTNRRNRGEDYHGLLRITLRRSTNLNRKIEGWIEGICEQCRVV